LFSAFTGSIAALEYRDAAAAAHALPELEAQVIDVPPLPAGVPESEVEERVARAREEATAEVERRFRAEIQEERRRIERRMSKALDEFSVERASYFRRAEHELVQLSLAIARKILEREAQADPVLLAGLVRIALDRMQCERAVKLRVPLVEVESWRAVQQSESQALQWIVQADETLSPGDCVVDTEMGTANFGFEAQLRGIEESFLMLMAQRPERP
jgi:flagellar assembly protein FliH